MGNISNGRGWQVWRSTMRYLLLLMLAGCQSVSVKARYQSILHSVEVEIITQKEDAMKSYQELADQFYREPSTWVGRNAGDVGLIKQYIELFCNYLAHADAPAHVPRNNIIEVLEKAQKNGTVFFSPSTLKTVAYCFDNAKLVEWNAEDWLEIDEELTRFIKITDWLEFMSPENVKQLAPRPKANYADKK